MWVVTAFKVFNGVLSMFLTVCVHDRTKCNNCKCGAVMFAIKLLDV